MQVGDLVVIRYPYMSGAPQFMTNPGLVLSVDVWQDSGSSRNCGVTVRVKWVSSGLIENYEEDELEVISESR